jgi:hypothetical protein
LNAGLMLEVFAVWPSSISRNVKTSSTNVG